MSKAKKRPNVIHLLQTQAFIEAAEDIDVDDEVLDDLRSDIETALDTQGALRLDADDVLDLGEDDGLDDPIYNALMAEADSAWPAQKVRSMKTYLKEKGMQAFSQKYVEARQIPIPKLLYAFDIVLCPELRHKRPKTMAFFLEVAMSRELHRRERLSEYSTIDDVIKLIQKAKNIVILTGAGISVSCGIPDFRSKNGLYAQLKERGEYDLDDPQQMFDLSYFKENPTVFYSFASQIYPSNFVPSPCHRFIKAIEDRGKLLRNYTQNIDTLEHTAGITRVVQCHGSFATASCLKCHRRVPITEIEADILAKRVPLCGICNTGVKKERNNNKGKGKKKKGKVDDGWGPEDDDVDIFPNGFPEAIMKPDITFFGEKLADEFDNSLKYDRERIDLLLVVGTSLKVAPVADIFLHLPHSVPQILINKTPIPHMNPDVILLGNADPIVEHLATRLSWDLPSLSGPIHEKKRKRSDGPEVDKKEPRRVANSHIWLFEGAEGGSFVEEMEAGAEGSKEHQESPEEDEEEWTAPAAKPGALSQKSKDKTPAKRAKTRHTD